MDKSIQGKVNLSDKWCEEECEGIALDEETIRDLRAKDKEDDCNTQREGNGDKGARSRSIEKMDEEKENITGDESDLEAVQNKYIVDSDNNEENFNTDEGSAAMYRASDNKFDDEEVDPDVENNAEYGDRENSENFVADDDDVNNSESNEGKSEDDGDAEPDEDIYETESRVNRVMQHLSSIGQMEEPEKEFRTFNAKLPDELDCLLTGVIVLGQFILVADNENKNVKRFSFGGVYVDHVDLEDPCGMCVLKEGADFVVTQPDFLKLTVVLGDIPLRRKCDISTEKRYDCVSSLSDGNLVCSCCKVGRTCVDIINQEGEVLLSFKSKKDGSKLFRNPAAIFAIKTGEILVSDSGSNRLCVLTQDGSAEYFFDTDGRPSGVAVDECGCAFVAHFDTNTVLRFSPDGSKEDLLAKHDEKLKSPLALALTSKHLVLTEEMPSNRVIVLMLPSCPVMDASNELAMSSIHLWLKQA